jgi:hypothetical protein
MNLSESVGGYFGLEINSGTSYHNDLVALNTGRNAFEYILRAKEYKHIYIPYYCCDVLLEPLHKLGIKYDFYSINEKFELATPVNINQESGFLYINYFGLKASYINELSSLIPNLIIDASQAFFYKPPAGIDTFYSPRKFFGVPDGGYVYCDKKLPVDFPVDISFDRFLHLIKRIDKGAEDGYANYKINEESLCNQPIKKMSKLTLALLNSIDYSGSLKKRNENFRYLHSSLKHKNRFKWLNENLTEGPMIYPFFLTDNALRKRLIDNHIYIARYWPNVENWVKEDSIEYKLYEDLFPLPIDHRYGEGEMKKIIAIING